MREKQTRRQENSTMGIQNLWPSHETTKLFWYSSLNLVLIIPLIWRVIQDSLITLPFSSSKFRIS